FEVGLAAEVDGHSRIFLVMAGHGNLPCAGCDSRLRFPAVDIFLPRRTGHSPPLSWKDEFEKHPTRDGWREGRAYRCVCRRHSLVPGRLSGIRAACRDPRGHRSPLPSSWRAPATGLFWRWDKRGTEEDLLCPSSGRSLALDAGASDGSDRANALPDADGGMRS